MKLSELPIRVASESPVRGISYHEVIFPTRFSSKTRSELEMSSIGTWPQAFFSFLPANFKARHRPFPTATGRFILILSSCRVVFLMFMIVSFIRGYAVWLTRHLNDGDRLRSKSVINACSPAQLDISDSSLDWLIVLLQNLFANARRRNPVESISNIARSRGFASPKLSYIGYYRRAAAWRCCMH